MLGELEHRARRDVKEVTCVQFSDTDEQEDRTGVAVLCDSQLRPGEQCWTVISRRQARYAAFMGGGQGPSEESKRNRNRSRQRRRSKKRGGDTPGSNLAEGGTAPAEEEARAEDKETGPLLGHGDRDPTPSPSGGGPASSASGNSE